VLYSRRVHVLSKSALCYFICPADLAAHLLQITFTKTFALSVLHRTVGNYITFHLINYSSYKKFQSKICTCKLCICVLSQAQIFFSRIKYFKKKIKCPVSFLCMVVVALEQNKKLNLTAFRKNQSWPH
jgi:hypothetical protein